MRDIWSGARRFTAFYDRAPCTPPKLSGDPILEAAMNPQLSPDDAHLNQLWRETFGQPLPLIGAPDIARRILRQNGVPDSALHRPAADEVKPARAPRGVNSIAL